MLISCIPSLLIPRSSGGTRCTGMPLIVLQPNRGHARQTASIADRITLPLTRRDCGILFPSHVIGWKRLIMQLGTSEGFSLGQFGALQPGSLETPGYSSFGGNPSSVGGVASSGGSAGIPEEGWSPYDGTSSTLGVAGGAGGGLLLTTLWLPL